MDHPAVPIAACLLVLLAAPVFSENLLPGGSFDDSLAPWTPSALPATWSALDAGNSTTSGSIEVVVDIPGPVGGPAAYSPCVPAPPGAYVAGIYVLLPTDQSPGRGGINFRTYSDPACLAQVSVITGPRLSTDESTGAWTFVTGSLTVPPGAAYIQADLSAARSDASGSLTLHLDNATLCPAEGSCAAGLEGWITDPQYPDFRFRVTITPNEESPIQGRKEPSCQPEVVCVSGALPGRSEVFLRIIGPRPNGFLWPTIVRFTPSRVDVEIEQLSTGHSREYVLDTVPPGDVTDLSGLQDREGFVP